MSLAGMGVVAVWHDVAPDAKDEFCEWHGREHLPERIGVPGFRRGRRYVALDGAPEYFCLYEADSPEVLAGADYHHRVSTPTEWTRRIAPSLRNVVRAHCRVAVTSGTGSGGLMLTQRFTIAAPHRAAALAALPQRIMPPLAYGAGIAGMHLCVADDVAPPAEPSERDARAGAIAAPGWVALIEGISVAAVRRAGEGLAAALAALHATGIDSTLYRHEVTRLKTPWSAG